MLCALTMIRLSAAWRKTSVKRTNGIAPDAMTSASTCPGPTEGSWSTSPTSSSAARSGKALSSARISGTSTMDVSSTTSRSQSRAFSSGSAEMLNWLVRDRGLEPHIRVYDKSNRTDYTLSREDFVYDYAGDSYRCPAGKTLQRYRRQFTVPRIGVMNDNSLRYRASKHDCGPCPLKPRCCPNVPA